MFQTLGLRHAKYDALTQNIGPIFALIIAIGFASFPLYAILTPYEPNQSPRVVPEPAGHGWVQPVESESAVVAREELKRW